MANCPNGKALAFGSFRSGGAPGRGRRYAAAGNVGQPSEDDRSAGLETETRTVGGRSESDGWTSCPEVDRGSESHAVRCSPEVGWPAVPATGYAGQGSMPLPRGRSTGPRTEEGAERSRQAARRHGFYSAKKERQEARARLLPCAECAISDLRQH